MEVPPPQSWNPQKSAIWKDGEGGVPARLTFSKILVVNLAGVGKLALRAHGVGVGQAVLLSHGEKAL